MENWVLTLQRNICDVSTVILPAHIKSTLLLNWYQPGIRVDICTKFHLTCDAFFGPPLVAPQVSVPATSIIRKSFISWPVPYCWIRVCESSTGTLSHCDIELLGQVCQGSSLVRELKSGIMTVAGLLNIGGLFSAVILKIPHTSRALFEFKGQKANPFIV